MKTPKTFKNKKYPAFIRDHKAIKKCATVTKDFEKVGLPDYREAYVHSTKVTLESFTLNLKRCISSLIKIWAKYIDCFHAPNKHLIRSELTKLLSKITEKNIKTKNKLVLPCAVRVPNAYRGKTINYDGGDSLLLLINNLCLDLSDSLGLEKVVAPFRRLLDHGVDLELSWNKNLEIVFSSRPWDIATMSMRGISSCQAWGKRQSTCLIGSIIDPSMAVMYLTDGEEHKKYGERMLARTVVRLTAPSMKLTPDGYVPVTKEESTQRALFLEGAYASFAAYTAQTVVFAEIFAESLNKKTDLKNRTLMTSTQAARYYCGIPSTPELKKLPDQYLSYRDSGLMYISLPS